MRTQYLQDFVNKTNQYRTQLFCLAASCCYLLAGQPQDASAATKKNNPDIPDKTKKLLAKLNEQMKMCSSESMLDRLQNKRGDALQTEMFSPKNAAILLAGGDACPGTNIPAGTSFSDTGNNTGANNTVNQINACSDYTTTHGPDHIYKFVLPALGSRIATCTIGLTTPAGTDHSIYTLSQGGGGCPGGTGNVVTNCVNGSDNVFIAGGTETITDPEMDAMPAGIYYLFVDSFYDVGDPDADGPYTLNFNCTTLAPTAAIVGVGGRVTTSEGRGIGNSRVSVVLPSGESRFVVTNQFGYFNFEDLEVGQAYVFQVSNKSYQFSNPAQLITVNETIDNLNFVAQPVGGKGGR